MKTLLLASLLLLSFSAMSAERSFQCNARYVFGNKDKAALTGIITSDTTLADVNYSIDDQTEFNASVLTPARKDLDKRFPYSTQFNVDGNYSLYMPIRMDSLFFFTAIVGNGKTFEKLECEIIDQ